MQSTALVDVRLLTVLATARIDVSVKEGKVLWLACQSAGNSTSGRAHGPTAMLWFVFQLTEEKGTFVMDVECLEPDPESEGFARQGN